MDKQQDRKNPSEEARLKRKSILHKKGLINRYRRSSRSGNMPQHANYDNHFFKPAMYVDIRRQSMTNGTPLSGNSKDQEIPFPSHNLSTANFGQPLNSFPNHNISMTNGTPLSDGSKDQEIPFPSHNLSTANFGQPLNSFPSHNLSTANFGQPLNSFPNHNISTARFGQPLNSTRHIIREKHCVPPGEPGIHTTQLEVNIQILMKKIYLKRTTGKILECLIQLCFEIEEKILKPGGYFLGSTPDTSNFHGSKVCSIPNLPTIQIPLPNPSIDINSQDVLIRRASMYQDYMEQIPIPSQRGSVIPFTSWIGLGRSIKKLYGQPLHYLTNIRLMQWDKLRIGSEDEFKPLDEIIHPCKAEATIWLMEEVHRQTSSHFHIANSWKMDPMYNGSVDSIFPALEHIMKEDI